MARRRDLGPCFAYDSLRQVWVTLVLFVLSFLNVPLWKAFLVMTRQTTNITIRSAIYCYVSLVDVVRDQ